MEPHSLSQLLPCPSRTRRSPCPKTCSAASASPPRWVRFLQAPTAPLLLLPPDLGPSFCRAAPGSLTVCRRAPLPRSGSFSLQPAPRGGVRPGCEENQERSRKGVSWWSAPSSDLGPPSLLPDASCPSGQLLAMPPPHPAPHYKCSYSSAMNQSHQWRGQNAQS